MTSAEASEVDRRYPDNDGIDSTFSDHMAFIFKAARLYEMDRTATKMAAGNALRLAEPQNAENAISVTGIPTAYASVPPVSGPHR